MTKELEAKLTKLIQPLVEQIVKKQKLNEVGSTTDKRTLLHHRIKVQKIIEKLKTLDLKKIETSLLDDDYSNDELDKILIAIMTLF
jgi:hypothetical protein